MISRKVNNVQEALEGIQDGQTIMLGGFGLCGIPENSIAELVRKNVTNLTCISNNAGVDKYRDWETDRKSTRLNSSHRL